MCGGVVGMVGVVGVGACPHNNHAQNEAPSRGAYCEKSYVGGDNNIERTQARTRTPAPPPARQACVVFIALFCVHQYM